MSPKIERTVYFRKTDMENDPLFQEYIGKRNLSETTANKIVYLLMNYSNLNNMMLSDLITEADEEEEKGIRHKKRKIGERLEKFRKAMFDNGFATSTIREDFNKIKTFYRTFKIEIPDLIIPQLPSKQLLYDEVPTKKDIKKAIESTNNRLHKALILFQFSSCSATAETTSISCEMFVKATEEYHNEVDINKVIPVLRKREEEIVPLFLLARQKKSNVVEEGYKYYTCCTPEATRYILDYLEDRIRKNGPLKNEDRLFNIAKGSVTTAYSRINDKNNFGRVGGDRRFFHSHGMRVAGNTAIGNKDDGDAFSGRKRSSIHESYFKNNPKELKKIYEKYIPKLSIEKTQVNYLNTEAAKMLQKQVKEAETRAKEAEDKVKEQNEIIINLQGGFKTLQEDVKKLKNPNRYYSEADLIDVMAKEHPEITPLMMKIIAEKMFEDHKDIEDKGKEKSYIQELINYANNILKLNPNHFTPEEIENIEAANKVNTLFSKFMLENTKKIYQHLIEKDITLNKKQMNEFFSYLKEYFTEVFYHENEKIDMDYAESLVFKIINKKPNEIIELYKSPNNPEMNKNKEYLKNKELKKDEEK